VAVARRKFLGDRQQLGVQASQAKLFNVELSRRHDSTRSSGNRNAFMPRLYAIQLCRQLTDVRQRLFERYAHLGFLLEELEDLRTNLNAAIQLRIGARYICTELNQVLCLVIGGERLADLARRPFCSGPDIFDCRRLMEFNTSIAEIVPGRSELPREDNMSIEYSANRVAHGLVKIVSFHKHGEETRKSNPGRSSRRARKCVATG